jgi:hypothetical protein
MLCWQHDALQLYPPPKYYEEFLWSLVSIGIKCCNKKPKKQQQRISNKNRALIQANKQFVITLKYIYYKLIYQQKVGLYHKKILVIIEQII